MVCYTAYAPKRIDDQISICKYATIGPKEKKNIICIMEKYGETFYSRQ